MLKFDGFENEEIYKGAETTLSNIWDGEGEEPTNSITMFVDKEVAESEEINIEFKIVSRDDNHLLNTIMITDVYEI